MAAPSFAIFKGWDDVLSAIKPVLLFFNIKVMQQRETQKHNKLRVVSPTLSKIRKERGSRFWSERESIKSKERASPLGKKVGN